MENTNNTSPVGFILLGFSDYPQLEVIFLYVISVFYILNLVGNTTIILLSYLDPKLHTPMYFFLSNLSLLDICFTTSIIPQMLWNLGGPDKSITYTGCIIQFSMALGLGSSECVLLAVMAYDRYIAICRPLHYVIIMNPRLLGVLAAVAWISGFLEALIQSILTFKLVFHSHHKLEDFMCEEPALIKIAAVDSTFIENELCIASIIYLVTPLSLILISYGCIANTTLRIKSTEGRKKVLGTCSSHLMVVTLFFGSVIAVYIQPNNKYSQNQSKFLTLFYTVVTPTLNPVIYTLRNKDVKGALRRLLGQNSASGER